MKEEYLSDEQKIKEINLVVGAVNGRTLSRVRRLIKILRAYQFAYGEMVELADLDNKKYAGYKRDIIIEGLTKDLKDIDLKFEGGTV